MKYRDTSFSVPAAGSQEYRDNWERTFRRQCGALSKGAAKFCTLPRGHQGLHAAPLAPALGGEPNAMVEWGDDE